MTDSKSIKARGAFDNLLDDAPTAEAIRDIEEDARTEREAAREGVRRVAAHVRDRGVQAGRLAHEKAHALGTSVRRHAPSVAERLRAAVAREIATPIRWRVVAPILLGSVAASGGMLAALLAWNTHRFAVLEAQGAATEQRSAPAAAESTVSQVPDVVAAKAPSVASTPAAPNTITPSPTVVTPPVAAQSEPVIATPVAPTLPAVPGELSRESCGAAVPLLNGLFAGAHARAPDEIAWAAFGYRCVQNGALSYSTSGYAPAALRIKEGGARIDPRVGAARTPKPAAKPKTSVAATTAPPSTASAALPAPATANALGACVLRVTATTAEGSVMPNVPVHITGVGGSRFEQRADTDGEGRLAANVPTGSRVRVVLRARGYLDDVRESMNCAPVALTGKKSNPLSSIFDAARRADRSIQDATGYR